MFGDTGGFNPFAGGEVACPRGRRGHGLRKLQRRLTASSVRATGIAAAASARRCLWSSTHRCHCWRRSSWARAGTLRGLDPRGPRGATGRARLHRAPHGSGGRGGPRRRLRAALRAAGRVYQPECRGADGRGPPAVRLLRGASGGVAPDGRALLSEATRAFGRPDPSAERGEAGTMSRRQRATRNACGGGRALLSRAREAGAPDCGASARLWSGAPPRRAGISAASAISLPFVPRVRASTRASAAMSRTTRARFAAARGSRRCRRPRRPDCRTRASWRPRCSRLEPG